jgi:predicted ATPase/DNA-binding SARP family transcriptional activator
VVAEFLILGPLEIRHDGRSLELGGTQRKALTATLLLRATEFVPAGVLIESLWGEDAAADATSALHAHVSRARRDLGELAGRLRTEPGGYRFVVEPDELDATRFVRGCEEGRSLLAAGRAAEAGDALRAALGLWRGPMLPELPYTQPEIRRFEELRAHALEERIEADLALRRHGVVLPELEGLLREYPLRERLRGQHMVALYRLGRHAEALDSYRELRRQLDELGLEPGGDVRELEQAILTHRLGGARDALPPVQTPTFGREDDLQRLCELVGRENVRLVTLTGPGGVGKTRLALEVARMVDASFVSLASLTDAGEVAPAMCEALGVARVPGEPAEDALHRALAREQAVIVLDNLEHLPHVEGVVRGLLSQAPAITVLGTSRQPLRLHAEHRFPVAPLESPAAVRLFTSRAQARGFPLDKRDEGAVIEICQRLGGHPLAVELAAARLGALDPAGLAERLGDALALLGPGPADAPARHRTLRATLDWSYALLSDEERSAFSALAAVAGGCSVAAAEAITGAPLAVLDAVVDKGLVTAAGGRLTMLEPIRQYAAALLAERDDADLVHARHFDVYLKLAESARRELWLRQQAAPVFATVHAERDNFRAALTWAAGPGREDQLVALVGALDEFWYATGADLEAGPWYARALSQPTRSVRLEHLARVHRGRSMLRIGGIAESIAAATKALDHYRELGDDAGIALCLAQLSTLHMIEAQQPLAYAEGQLAVRHAEASGDIGLVGFAQTKLALAAPDFDEALPLLDEATRTLRRAGATDRVAVAMSVAAWLALVREAYDVAERLFDEALALAGATHRTHAVALIHGNRGLLALLRDQPEQARQAFAAQLQVAQGQALARSYYSAALFGLAAVAASDGQLERAATLDAAAQQQSVRPHGANEAPVYQRVAARYIAPARERLGVTAWERAAVQGRELTPAQAVELALDVSAL